ncbi:MAG TPA: hypothetical protein VNF45_07140 [Candidatus Binataceae bacterium]|nr:hypothetical protein [Candidatus Binataceae bacterium]
MRTRKGASIRTVITLLTLAGLTAAGCFQLQPQPAVPPTTMTSWGPLGSFTMSSGAVCAGQTTVTEGTASVVDPCFTGNTNVVLCTDMTTASAVKCAPGAGTLVISGAKGDTISYARVK